MAEETQTGLTAEERVFLALLGAALREETLTETESADWQRVFAMADRHHVLPLALESACRCPGIPAELMNEAEERAMLTVIGQAVRTGAFLSLYRHLREAGCAPSVVKGLVCRQLYPQPDSRPSSDEDMLIAPVELPAVHALLASRDMVTDDGQPPTPGADEVTYMGPDRLRIELHTSLFPASGAVYRQMNALFDGALDRTVTEEVQGVPIRTLCPTDHVLYLLCHACKHFFHTGVGIRQVCDIGMFSRRYGGEIDWARVRSGCEAVRMADFAAAVYRIGTNHLGLETPEVFSDLHPDETGMLRDMLSGGVYGAADETRLNSSTVTTEAVEAHYEGRSARGVSAALFPSADSLKGRYPYLADRPWLLPAAWGQRIFRYLRRSGDRAGGDAGESLRIGRERTALLRQYGVID